MVKKKKDSLSHISFTVLSLMSEEESHGYKINKKIQDRGMRHWTNIGQSSIYSVINGLEAENYVESYTEEVDNRTRKVYKITDKGITILKKKVKTVLSNFIGRNDENFYIAYSMLPFISEEEVIKAFNNSLNNIKTQKKELEKMLEENSHMPLNVRGLFVHPIKILQTDIEFLEWTLEEIKKGGGNIKSKIHS
ncbi:MAG: PadR family transcriptional regulator [Promethearchaeota archaeon]